MLKTVCTGPGISCGCSNLLGHTTSDPRSIELLLRLGCFIAISQRTMDQGSGQVVCVSLAIILLAFSGASPICCLYPDSTKGKFYCFVSAIKLQMRLRLHLILSHIISQALFLSFFIFFLLTYITI